MPPSYGQVSGPSLAPASLAGQYAQPPATNQQGRQPSANVAANPKPRLARAKVDDPPLVKHSRPKEMPPAPITLPSPEELGVSMTKAFGESFDWSPIQRRFREAGASCFHVEFPPEGGCKLICLLPCDRSDRTHRIDAEASSEEETARLAIKKLDEWHLAEKR